MKTGGGIWPPRGSLKRGGGRKLDSAGIGIPASVPDSYDEAESARGLLVGGVGGGGSTEAAAVEVALWKWPSTRQSAILV